MNKTLSHMAAEWSLTSIGVREKFCWGGLNMICPNESYWSQVHKMILS